MGRRKKSDKPVVSKPMTMLQATAQVEDSGNKRYWDERLEMLAKASLEWEFDITKFRNLNSPTAEAEIEYMFASMHRLKDAKRPIDVDNFKQIFGKFENCMSYLNEKAADIRRYNNSLKTL